MGNHFAREFSFTQHLANGTDASPIKNTKDRTKVSIFE